MTAALVTIAIATATAVGLAAYLGVQYVRLIPRYLAAEDGRRIQVGKVASLDAQLVERNAYVERLLAENVAVRSERDRFRAAAVVGMSDDDLRDLGNGVRSDPVRPDSNPAAAKVTVSDGTGSAAGAIDDDLR